MDHLFQQSGLATLVSRQHGTVAHRQLIAFGWDDDAIKHRIATGWLHRVFRGVYAVGRPDLTERGFWVAATLACDDDSALSHQSAAALWGIRPHRGGPIHVSVPGAEHRYRGIRLHRRTPMPQVTTVDFIRVTTPAWTLVDLAAVVSLEELTTAANEADKLGLIDHDEFAALVESLPRRRGIRKLRLILGIQRTDSNLERAFLRLVDGSALPRPLTQQFVHGLRVDFFWPELRLVVETDGLTYHRTPAEQAVDRKRDQLLTAAGLTCLRFTNAQIRYDARDVRATLERVAARLR